MVFRKPYAFFIKMFKPIHIIVGLAIGYLIYLESNIFSFLNTYISSYESVIGQSVREKFASNFIFLIPLILKSETSLIFIIVPSSISIITNAV